MTFPPLLLCFGEKSSFFWKDTWKLTESSEEDEEEELLELEDESEL